MQALAGAWDWQAVGDAASRLWWVADAERMTVRGAAGVLDLSATPLMMKLISGLARHGGEARAETLLPDDRAHAAMRTLRRALEGIGLADAIETRDGGYRLNGRVLFRRPANP